MSNTPAQGAAVNETAKKNLVPRVMLILLVAFLLLSDAAAADQLTSRGAALMNACAACHGPDGRSQGAIPAIDAMSSERLVTALRAFRAGERQGTVMNRIAKGLDEADIEAVAAYVGAPRSR